MSALHRWAACVLLVVGATTSTFVEAADTSTAPVALVTGSDRGIGLALVQELTTRGWTVIATCRNPLRANELQQFASKHPSVSVEPLDVADDAAIDQLAAKYRGKPIDALINNAGITGELLKQHVGAFQGTDFDQVLHINSYAPLRVSQAFVENVALSQQKKIIAISSGAGSITSIKEQRNTYFYAMSKSALNMGMRILQNEVRDRGILVGIVSPGPVETDMQRDYRAAATQLGTPVKYTAISVDQSAAALVTYITTLSADNAGHFYEYNGKEIPW